MSTPESPEQIGVANSGWSKPTHRRAGPQNEFTPFALSETETSIVSRFEAQVAKYPDAIAIGDQVYEWSYRELNRIANRIAFELEREGGSAEVPVALLFEHGAPAIAAIFGALKLGRCYVPLNTRQPAARLAAIFKDIGAGIIVTNQCNMAMAAEVSAGAAKLIPIDELLTQPREDNLGLAISADALACVLFTSGSTGAPKGVMHNHRNILCNAMNVTNVLHVSANDRFDQLYGYDTGAAVPQIYAALLNGASVHLFDLGTRGFVDLADWIAEKKITIYHSVPQVFRHLVAALGAEFAFPELRLIRLGGEATSVADVELYQKSLSKSAILQVSFGATEIAPIRGLFIDRNTPLDGTIVPTGYEIPGVEVVILDDEGREAGPQVAGQIAIKSRHLFLGYWNDQAQTAAVLSTLPDGRRMYRTSDRGVILRDGCLIHLGRSGSMVKISGVRIEVAEVETALLRIPGVREAVVVGRPDHRGDMRLIAYVVGEATAPELRRRLKEQVPLAMIPSAFVAMKALPVNHIGKVDRSALPNPEAIPTGIHPPRDALETSLVAIWSEVLGHQSIGIRDDFFRLGGDSLAALELFERIEAALGRIVPVSILAEHPTVEQQAAVLRNPKASSRWPSVVPLQLRGDRPPVFFVPGAGSDVISLMGFARGIGFDQPFYGLQPPGLDDLGFPSHSVEELASHFLPELRRAHPHGPYFLGGASFGGLVAFEMAQRLTALGERVEFLGLLDTHASQFPTMHSRAPVRFRIFRRLVGQFQQSPKQNAAAVVRHAFRVWEARFFNRLRWIRRRPLSREGRYLYYFEQAVRERRSYRIRPYPGKVTLFRYGEQPSAELYDPDPLMGWGAVADTLEIVDVPGTHTDLAPHDFQEICRQLREHLEAAQAQAIASES